jgi:hypothetical protein
MQPPQAGTADVDHGDPLGLERREGFNRFTAPAGLREHYPRGRQARRRPVEVPEVDAVGSHTVLAKVPYRRVQGGVTCADAREEGRAGTGGKSCNWRGTISVTRSRLSGCAFNASANDENLWVMNPSFTELRVQVETVIPITYQDAIPLV